MSVDYASARRTHTGDVTGGVRNTPATAHRASTKSPSVINEVTRQPGMPLEPTMQRMMEHRFGNDFGQVRVHADERAAASARGLDALAYTCGSHVVFGTGQYAPRTPTGLRLLAHELTHVAQQQSSHRGSDSTMQDPDEATLEHEADIAATAVGKGDTPQVHHHGAGVLPLRQAAPPGPAAAPVGAAKPLREERFNLGRGGGRVDADLDRSSGWLTVKVKVKFMMLNSPQPWPSPARFEQFKTDFAEAVTKRWSFKHFLVPQRACPDEPQRVVVRLQVIPVTSAQHFTANVGFTSDYVQSSVTDRTATLDVLDTAQRADLPQTPSEHEFGHMLGLPHIRCAGTGDCYGVTSNERADVMGEGSYVSPRDYEVFAELMPYFTGCNYNVQQASFIPTSRAPGIGGAIGFLGGGVGGALAGAAIGGLFGPVGAIVGGLVGLVGGAIGGYFAGRAIATPRVPS